MIERIPVQMGTAGDTDTPIKGHLQLVDNQVDAKSGTVRVRAVFDNKDGALIPAVRAPAHGQAKADAALLISERAVGTDQNKKFVMVVGADNKVEYREVTLGAHVDGLRIVTSGLKSDERVVVNGLQRVPAVPRWSHRRQVAMTVAVARGGARARAPGRTEARPPGRRPSFEEHPREDQDGLAAAARALKTPCTPHASRTKPQDSEGAPRESLQVLHRPPSSPACCRCWCSSPALIAVRSLPISEYSRSRAALGGRGARTTPAPTRR
jgi:hypothetical protein